MLLQRPGVPRSSSQGTPFARSEPSQSLSIPSFAQSASSGRPGLRAGSASSQSVLSVTSLPMQTLSMWIIDGVLERFPELRVGVVELGAVWVPSFMRQLDAAFDAFGRHEDRLQSLSLRPSEYVKRQVRVTPYPTEPTGWIIENSAPEICMFSSDYPHVEGGRNPLGRFDREVEEHTDAVRDRFYRSNFEDLMGNGLPPSLCGL